MIRRTLVSDVPRLKELWGEAFPNDEICRDTFFETLFAPEDSFVWTEGTLISAMLHTVAYPLFADGTRRRARYVYAVATDRAFRSRGLCRALHDAAREAFSGDTFFLIPEGEELIAFWQKFSYRPWGVRPRFEPLGKRTALTVQDAWERYCGAFCNGVRLDRESFFLTALDKTFFFVEGDAYPFYVESADGITGFFDTHSKTDSTPTALVLGEEDAVVLPYLLN